MFGIKLNQRIAITLQAHFLLPISPPSYISLFSRLTRLEHADLILVGHIRPTRSRSHSCWLMSADPASIPFLWWRHAWLIASCLRYSSGKCTASFLTLFVISHSRWAHHRLVLTDGIESLDWTSDCRWPDERTSTCKLFVVFLLKTLHPDVTQDWEVCFKLFSVEPVQFEKLIFFLDPL